MSRLHEALHQTRELIVFEHPSFPGSLNIGAGDDPTERLDKAEVAALCLDLLRWLRIESARERKDAPFCEYNPRPDIPKRRHIPGQRCGWCGWEG